MSGSGTGSVGGSGRVEMEVARGSSAAGDSCCGGTFVFVKDASSTQAYSFLPASWVGDTHKETDVLPISG